jgi:hypothetical protein
MKLGLYIFATLALITIIGVLVYTINPNKYMIEMMNIKFDFHIAIWMILPMLLLFLFTLGHMLFYGLRNYMTLKKWQRDTLTLEEALYASLIHEPKYAKYSMNEIGSVSVLLTKASLTLSDTIEGLSPKLSKITHLVQKIQNGEYVDLKEHKVSKIFKKGNPLLIQNRLNRLKCDNEFVEEVMRSSSEYSKRVQAEALNIFAKSEDFIQARKYIKVFDEKHLILMLSRIDYDETLGLSNDILNEFVSTLKLKCQDFISIARITKKYFSPEENLALFYEYQSKNEKAQNAYLYLLFEYELLDQVANYLQEQGEFEFMKFRALYILKREHSGYKLDDIINIDVLCQEKKPL